MRPYVSQSQFRSALSVHGEKAAVSNALSLAATVGVNHKKSMFGLFPKKEYSISFNPSLVNELDEVLTETYEILRDEAYTAQADCIARILVTVNNEDPAAFKKAVLTNDLLGGAGSVVDVWLENEKKMKRLDELLNRFLRLTYDGGLMHKAVKSRMNEKKKD